MLTKSCNIKEHSKKKTLCICVCGYSYTCTHALKTSYTKEQNNSKIKCFFFNFTQLMLNEEKNSFFCLMMKKRKKKNKK